jgi:hypothetical protein
MAKALLVCAPPLSVTYACARACDDVAPSAVEIAIAKSMPHTLPATNSVVRIASF